VNGKVVVFVCFLWGFLKTTLKKQARTIKVLQAIARGLCIVDEQWLNESIEVCFFAFVFTHRFQGFKTFERPKSCLFRTRRWWIIFPEHPSRVRSTWTKTQECLKKN
jgi:hypothetical protein